MQAVIGLEQSVVLARVLFGIASTFRRLLLSPEDALERVSISLGSEREKDQRFANWELCRKGLMRLLNTRSISLAAKAIDTSYDFERVYLAGRILTSIRRFLMPRGRNLWDQP
jgi:hypothetical protein